MKLSLKGFSATVLILALVGFSCTKNPLDPDLDDPIPGFSTNSVPRPVEKRWYVIDEANKSVQHVLRTNSYTVTANVLTPGNSDIMADIHIVSRSAYIMGGYASWNSSGSHDIKKVDLGGSGTLQKRYDFGAGRTITSGASAVYQEMKIFVAHYSSSDGKFQEFDLDLGANRTVNIGGNPQGLAVWNGDVFIANYDSYAYATNWIDVIRAGGSSSTRILLTNKNPKSISVSADGLRLYVLTGGTYDMSYNPNNDGSLIVMTNLTGTLAIQKVIPLGINPSGTVREIGGIPYFTSFGGFYEIDLGGNTFSLKALSGKSLMDIDFDMEYIYLTGQYGTGEGFILKRSDFSTHQALTMNGGMGALYK